MPWAAPDRAAAPGAGALRAPRDIPRWRRALAALPALCALLVPAGPARGADPADVLREADRARGNLRGVTWELEVVAREGDRETRMAATVQSRGYSFLSETREPPKHRGQKLLMVTGTMWFWKPGLRKPVSISPRQRLAGQAAYGDIAATNYADEYDATVAGTDVVDGEPCTVFDLRARGRDVTYDGIRYWISDARGVGVRAEYFTVSGKLIKRASMEYAETVTVDGRRQPFISRLVITDAVLAGNVTTLVFRRPEFREIPDRVLNVNALGS